MNEPGRSRSALRVPPARYAFLDAPTPITDAHRGGAIEHLEQHDARVPGVRGPGYRYLETDVRVTADGVLVAFHDLTLERVTDRTGRVEFDVGRGRGGLDRRAGADPAPEELLGAWPDASGFNLDIKAAGVRAPGGLVRRMDIAGPPLPRFLLRRPDGWRPGACSVRTLCTSLGPRGVAALRLSSQLCWPAAGLVRIQAGCAQVPLQLGGRALVDERFVAAAHQRPAGARVGRSTTRRRPPPCSISASTGS